MTTGVPLVSLATKLGSVAPSATHCGIWAQPVGVTVMARYDPKRPGINSRGGWLVHWSLFS